MNNMQKFKFIDGHFSPLESREILKNVFNSKIQFHQVKNFSSQERYGKDDEHSLHRIVELKESIDKIVKFLDEARHEGRQLEIKSEIEITIL